MDEPHLGRRRRVRGDEEDVRPQPRRVGDDARGQRYVHDRLPVVRLVEAVREPVLRPHERRGGGRRVGQGGARPAHGAPRHWAGQVPLYGALAKEAEDAREAATGALLLRGGCVRRGARSLCRSLLGRLLDNRRDGILAQRDRRRALGGL